MLNNKVKHAKIAILNDEQVAQLAEVGYWDDNGGDPDGSLYICHGADAPAGATIINGYEVEYNSAESGCEVNDYCGWSSRGFALTANLETANTIAAAETSAEEANSI